MMIAEYVCICSMLLVAPHANAQEPGANGCDRDKPRIVQAHCYLGRKNVGPIFLDLLSEDPTYTIPTDVNQPLLKAYLAEKGISEREIGGALSRPIQEARYFVVWPLDRAASSDAAMRSYEPYSELYARSILTLQEGRFVALGDIAGSKKKFQGFRDETVIVAGVPGTVESLSNMSRLTKNTAQKLFHDIQRNLALAYVAASVRSGNWLIPALSRYMLSNADQGYEDRATHEWIKLLPEILESIQSGRSEVVGSPVIAKRIEFSLSVAYSKAEQEIKEARRSLRLVSFKQADGTTVEGYGANYIKELITTGKFRLLSMLEDGELAGVRAYVNQFFPSADSIPVFRVKGHTLRPNTAGFFRAGFWNGEPQVLLVTPESVNAVYDRVYGFFAKLRRNKKVIDLDIVSEPQEASVGLFADLGARRSTVTNGTLTNVPRGLYEYRINKNGFKSISGSINLIDERGTVLTCKVYRNEATDGPYPCGLK